MSAILHFLADMGYWTVPLAVPGVIALMMWKHRSRLLIVYLSVIAILGAVARWGYIHLCHAPSSIRYYLLSCWIFFLCGSIGMAFLCNLPRRKWIRVLLAAFWVLIVGASFSAKIIHHGLSSSRKNLAQVGAIVKSEIEAKHPSSVGFLCDKLDTRISLPPEVVVYPMHKRAPFETSSLTRQAVINHDFLFLLVNKRMRERDVQKIIFGALEECGECVIRELGTSRKAHYGALYCVELPPPKLNFGGTPLLDSQVFFKTFAGLGFPEAKLRRLVERRMSPEQFKDFLLPAHWSVDETCSWNPLCFPASSSVVTGGDGAYWHISSKQKISMVCSAQPSCDAPQWLLVVDLEGASADAKFQPAVVSGAGYSYNIPLAVGGRKKYHFILEPPAKPASGRLAIFTEGAVNIYDLKLYPYNDLRKTNLNKEQTSSGN